MADTPGTPGTPRKPGSKRATRATPPDYTPPETIERGFGADPEVLYEDSDMLAVKRVDTLAVPRVTQNRGFDPPPRDGGIRTETDLIGAETVVESQANLMLQYLASMGPAIAPQFGSPVGLFQSTGLHALPPYTDELEHDFGTDIYAKRMMYDAVVRARFETLLDGILDRPIVISPGLDPEDEQKPAGVEGGGTKAPGIKGSERYTEFATEVARFVQYNFDDMQGGFMLKLRSMLQGIALGYKIAELVYERREPEPGMGRKTCLKDMHPKSHDAVSMVADMYNTVVGYLPRMRGSGIQGAFTLGELGVRTVEDLDADGRVIKERVHIPEMIPPEKVARYTWNPDNDDPRGQSHLRAAYIPWRLKVGLYPAWEAYLARFAQPSVGLELGGQEMPSMMGVDGKVLTNPVAIASALLLSLRNWQAGGAFVAPVGKLNLVQAEGDGQAYLSAFELVDAQITTSILHANLSTEGGKYGTQALGEVHQDTTDMLYALGKYATAMFVREQLVRPLVYFNYGEQGLMVLPEVTFEEVEQQDQAAIGGMLSSMKGAEFLFPPQYNDAFSMVGLPELDDETIKLLTDLWLKTMEQQAQMQQQQLAMGQATIEGVQQQQQQAQANPSQPPGQAGGPAQGNTQGGPRTGGSVALSGSQGTQSSRGSQPQPKAQDYYGE